MSKAAKTTRREFLQLAETYNRAKHKIAGYYVSHKLDGTRCFWDGGLSRGIPTGDVPWASITDPKTGSRKAKIKPRATGLWSRYGNPIIAPDWFLNQLPCCPLDGELWAGVGQFQLCRSICAGDEPDPRFDRISYAVYSSPPLPHVFQSGLVKNANMLRDMDVDQIEAWVKSRLGDIEGFISCHGTFEDELLFLAEALDTQNDHVFLHRQTRLSSDEDEAREQVYTHLNAVLAEGGEGVVLRDPKAAWIPKRHKGVLKFKPFLDAEGMIVGFTAGREGKEGRLLGKIGALILDYGGKRLELAGLTDEEREFSTEEARLYATAHPGEDMPTCFMGRHFTICDTVTFKYRELTDDGIPKEARYFRQRNEE